MKMWVSKHPYNCRTPLPINETPMSNLQPGLKVRYGQWRIEKSTKVEDKSHEGAIIQPGALSNVETP